MSIEPLNHRIQQLQRLLEAGRNLSAMLDLEPLLQTIIDLAADLTDSQEASILLYNEKDKNLEFVTAPWLKRDEMRGIRVPLDKSIAGQVFSYGEPVLVKNALGDPRIYRQVDSETEFETRSMLAVPLKIKGKATGVLTAVNKLEDVTFTENDINILETLASQAAIAIQNARLMQQTKKAYEELSQLDQMKSDFIAITSHELRTPLGLILGHATFLNEMVPEELQSQMDVVVRSAMRLKEIVEDLSKVNNFQTGQARLRRQAIDIKELLQEVVNSFKRSTREKELELRLDLPDTPLVLEVDNEKIGIALSHLLRNCITFCDPGDHIWVRAEQLPGHVKIEVQDTGIGIPSRDTSRIFERFYQVESHMTRRHGGMGLGLSVAKMMIEMHNGRINVHSEEGHGSLFTVLLPIPKTPVTLTDETPSETSGEAPSETPDETPSKPPFIE